MTQEEKFILLQDLSARLPYGIFVKENRSLDDSPIIYTYDYHPYIDNCKPYLRPMSSMTEEEKKIICSMNMLSDIELSDRLNYQKMYVQNYTIETFDLFNEHHLDYRGLIPIGLALPASEDMYNIKYND